MGVGLFKSLLVVVHTPLCIIILGVPAQSSNFRPGDGPSRGALPKNRSQTEGEVELLEEEVDQLTQIKKKAPTREDPGGGRHHFAPDDEDAFEYENYHNPDHTY
jgi:hypothetical protein